MIKESNYEPISYITPLTTMLYILFIREHLYLFIDLNMSSKIIFTSITIKVALFVFGYLIYHLILTANSVTGGYTNISLCGPHEIKLENDLLGKY